MNDRPTTQSPGLRMSEPAPSHQPHPGMARGWLKRGRSKLTSTLLNALAQLPIPLPIPQLDYRRGLMQAERGDYAAAISAYEQTLGSRHTPPAGIYHHLGQAQLKTGLAVAAATSFRRAIALQPEAAWSYQGLGETLLAQDQPADAEEAFRVGLEHQPDNPWLYFHLSRSLSRQGRQAEALDAWLERCAISAAGPLLVLPFPPDFLLPEQCTPTRLQTLREILARHPQATAPQHLLAWMLVLREDYRDAVEPLRRVALERWRQDYPAQPAATVAEPWTPPAFMMIGQGKAGTTALFSYLCQHPRVAAPVMKEPHYWSRHFSAAADGDWYRACFPPIPAESALITGEASTDYFTHEQAPTRIAEAFPHLKLILLLRDPVARAYSHYQMYRRIGWEQRDWASIVAAELEALPTCPLAEPELAAAPPLVHRQAYLLSGAALLFLQRWLRLFPSEQLLILQHAEMRRDTAATVRRVYRFLGLPHFSPDCREWINQGRYPPMAPELQQRLQAWFRPHQEALAQFLAGLEPTAPGDGGPSAARGAATADPE